MNHNWYTNPDGSPKSHRRAHSCANCKENPRGGCPLPFRRTRRVRLIAAMDRKPMFFSGLWFSNFMRGKR